MTDIAGQAARTRPNSSGMLTHQTAKVRADDESFFSLKLAP
jgi:hypothetical protein